MNPANYADLVIAAITDQRGEELAKLFSLSALSPYPIASPSDQVIIHLRDQRPHRIQSALVKCQGFLAAPWTDILTQQIVIAQRLSFLPRIDVRHMTIAIPSQGFGYNAAVDDTGRTIRDVVEEAWEAINSLVTAFLRYFTSLTPGRWSLPLLYTLLSHHRSLSILADNIASNMAGQSNRVNKRLEECARQLNKAFSACIADRTTEEEDSRKWGVYEVVGMVFRGYFRLKSLPLCRNILRALNAADLPSFDRYPRSQKITFKYYVGVLAFLGEDYKKAEGELSFAFQECHYKALHNQQMILQYLIPCRILSGSLPSSHLLSRFPSLNAMYSPFITAIRQGDVRSFDIALATPNLEKALVKNGTYLCIERAREITLRGLLKKVYRCKNGKSRISIEEFHRALLFVGVNGDLLETEWLVATQIAKGFLRGYISHSHMMTVLSAQNPFPPLHTIAVS